MVYKKLSYGCLGGILAFLFMGYLGAWFIAPGSYPRAETYNFSISEDSLIALIIEVKNDNPDISISNRIRDQDITNGLYLDGKTKDGNWFHIFFHYPETNEIVHTWTRPKGRNQTTFAFHRLTNLDTDDSRIINDSFWWWNNREDIKKFEKRILNRIKEKTFANH